MAILNNRKHEAFARNLASGNFKSQGEAYIAAGYRAKPGDSADAAASICLNRFKEVGERVKELTGRITEGVALSREWVLERLIENVERSMQRRAVLDHEGNETGEYKYDGAVANKALELLGKEMRMFVDRRETVLKYQDMTDEQLVARYRSLREAIIAEGAPDRTDRDSGGTEAPPRPH